MADAKISMYLPPNVNPTQAAIAYGCRAPGKSGLVSRGSKVLRFPLESRRVKYQGDSLSLVPIPLQALAE